MTDVEREPCPQCGEPAAIAGRVCPHCSASLLVDVVAAGPIADPRARYQAARDLARLSPGFLSLPGLREVLSQPEGGVLATRLTREGARRVLALLESHGGRGRAVAAPLSGAPENVPDLGRSLARPEGLGRPARIVAAAAVLAAGAWFLSRRTPSPPPRVSAEFPPTARPSAGPTRPARDVAAAALASTAALRCGSSGGAGFFVTPELLVTNAHVLCAGRAPLEVALPDGRRIEGSVAASDPWLDLAVVAVPGAAARPLPLGDAMAVEPGDPVLFIGSPLGMDFTVSRAIVSHPRRNVYGVAFVQFDANVNPGNSGGPLLDGEGRAIGVVSMMLADSRGLAFALPVNYLYDLPSVHLPVPVPPPDFEAWRKTLASVRRQDMAEADAVRQAFRRPALGAAAVDREGRLYAVVVTRGQPAGSVPYRFAVRRSGQILCSPMGLVATWGPVSGRGPGPATDPRFLRWLARIDLGAEVSSGSAELSLDGCPDGRSLIGAELLLEGAEPSAGRAVIDVVREVY